ncbi:Juxtaposed with another zinc finger protein 1 [Mortierella alpina]|nr:Juxtaposed with another zinc finger protein 1 [Mortierella alpina]
MPATVDIHSPRLLRQHSNQSTPLIPQYPHLGAALEFENDFGPESSSRVTALEASQAREFETAYCRDFYCCGLTLLDLHDLLQHCEECHVHFEEDDLDTDNEAEDDDHDMAVRRRDSDSSEDHGWSDSDSLPSSPSTASPPRSDMSSVTSGSSRHRDAIATLRANARLASKLTGSDYSSSLLNENQLPRSTQTFAFDSVNSTTHALEAFSATFGTSAKRKAVVSMSDIYSAGDEDGQNAHTVMFSNSNRRSKSNTAVDHLGPMIKRHAAASAPSITSKSWTESHIRQAYPHPLSASSIGPYFGNIGQPGPNYVGRAPMFSQGAPAYAWPSLASTAPITSLADLIRQRDEIFNIIDDLTRIPQNASGENKPYRCAVPGCDKAYKNPNGLKYHNLHGHSSSSVASSSCAGSGEATGNGDGDSVENKPYVCTFLECGKRYKNLNGLKYHIEHTHPNFMAALRAHQSGLINHPLLLQLAPLKEHHHDVMMTLTAALAAVEASPMMAMAANAVLQSAATSAANQLNGHSAAVHAPGFGIGSSGGSDARSLNVTSMSEAGSSLMPVRGSNSETTAGPGPSTTHCNSHPTIPIAPATLTSSSKK